VKSFSDSEIGGTRSLKTVFLGAAALLVLAIVILLRQVLTPVIIALVIAYIADPLLRCLDGHRIGRGTATTLLYVSVLAVLAIAGVALGPRVTNQAQRLYRNVSGLAQDYGFTLLEETGGGGQVAGDDDAGKKETDPLATGIAGAIDERLPEWGRRAQDYLRDHADKIAAPVAGWVVTVGRNTAKGLSNAAGFVFGLILVLVFTFFFMLHFHRMIDTVKRYIPAAHRKRTLRILGRIDGAVSNFFRGRLLVCAIAGVVYVIGLRLSGIDFWLLIGLVGGVLSFVPILGVVLPLIPACAFALLTGHPWASLLGVLVTFSVVQWVVEPIAGTLILSRQVRMHPVTIILALLIGGSLFGLFGVILSVPLAAVVRILGKEFVLPPLREMAEE
jgi:predicted PurR-regulated permease PerM